MTAYRLRILLVVVVLLTLLFGVFAGQALPAESFAGRLIMDPTNLDAMSRAYHCGDQFHGHKIRGYLIGKSGTYLHIKPVPPETLSLWIKRGVLFGRCSK
jgi:hypothetical protein